MKRKALIFLIAGVTFLSGFSSVAALLGTGLPAAESDPAARIQLDQAEKAPIAIAGNSWGGRADDGSDDEQIDPPEVNGNSWGG